MKKTLKRCVLALLLPGMLNFILLSDAANQRMAASQVPLVIRIGLLITLAVCFGLLYLGLLVMPAFDSVKTGQRVRMMLGGRSLVYKGLYAMAVEMVIFFIFYIYKAEICDFDNYINSTTMSDGAERGLKSFSKGFR